MLRVCSHTPKETGINKPRLKKGTTLLSSTTSNMVAATNAHCAEQFQIPTGLITRSVDYVISGHGVHFFCFFFKHDFNIDLTKRESVCPQHRDKNNTVLVLAAAYFGTGIVH